MGTYRYPDQLPKRPPADTAELALAYFEGQGRFADYLHRPINPSLSQAAKHRNRVGDTKRIFEELPPREREALRLRFGLDGRQRAIGVDRCEFLRMMPDDLARLEHEAIEHFAELYYGRSVEPPFDPSPREVSGFDRTTEEG